MSTPKVRAVPGPGADEGPPDRLALSALADGEVRGSEVDRLLDRWARDPVLQRDWRDWHRIGDVMRSDECAQPLPHEVAFVHRLRVRLVEHRPLPPERVSIRTVPAAAAVARSAQAPGVSSGWRMPLALAAGVAAVAFGISWLQWPQDPAGEPVVSRLQLPQAPRVGAPSAVPPVRSAMTQALPAASSRTLDRGAALGPLAPTQPPAGWGGPLLRDPVLDQVLRAQRSAPAMAPSVGPSSQPPFGRVETVGIER